MAAEFTSAATRVSAHKALCMVQQRQRLEASFIRIHDRSVGLARCSPSWELSLSALVRQLDALVRGRELDSQQELLDDLFPEVVASRQLTSPPHGGSEPVVLLQRDQLG